VVVVASSATDQRSTAFPLLANVNQWPCVLHSRRESAIVEAVVDSVTEATVMMRPHTVHLDQITVPLELLVTRFRRVSVIEATLVATATMRMHHLHR